jgi:hypothetical protein
LPGDTVTLAGSRIEILLPFVQMGKTWGNMQLNKRKSDQISVDTGSVHTKVKNEKGVGKRRAEDTGGSSSKVAAKVEMSAGTGMAEDTGSSSSNAAVKDERDVGKRRAEDTGSSSSNAAVKDERDVGKRRRTEDTGGSSSSSSNAAVKDERDVGKRRAEDTGSSSSSKVAAKVEMSAGTGMAEDTGSSSNVSKKLNGKDKDTFKRCTTNFCGRVSDGPSLFDIYNEFFDDPERNPRNFRRDKEWLDLLGESCQNYGWGPGGNCRCEYSERGGWAMHGAYARMHGAETLFWSISYFVGEFIPRKMCTPSMNEMKNCAAALRSFVKFCAKKGYISKEDTKRTLDELKVTNSFDAEGIREALQNLADSGWWDALETETASGSEEEDLHRFHDNDMGTTVVKVLKDGWMVVEDFEFGERGVFLPLPPKVASKGLVGMSMSCMSMSLKGGVWRPVGTYDYDMVLANVYPP